MRGQRGKGIDGNFDDIFQGERMREPATIPEGSGLSYGRVEDDVVTALKKPRGGKETGPCKKPRCLKASRSGSLGDACKRTQALGGSHEKEGPGGSQPTATLVSGAH